MRREEEIEELERRFPELAQSAFTQAYQRTLAAGLGVLVTDNGTLCEVFPDGTRKMIKQIERPTLLAKGSKLRIQ